mgnify:CR=1 FL=1
MALNLYDLTEGNYRISRTITYPDFPESKIVTDGRVKAVRNSEWDTTLNINGTYNGPTDVISVKDYKLNWTTEGNKILESGSATLVLKSGKSIQQIWESIITPEKNLDHFPESGESATISFSSFEINGNEMSYKWEGTVKVQ